MAKVKSCLKNCIRDSTTSDGFVKTYEISIADESSQTVAKFKLSHPIINLSWDQLRNLLTPNQTDFTSGKR